MADDPPDPHDDKVASVPLPTEGTDEVIEQENQSPEVALGGGEWPSPATAPTGPAPGTEGAGHGPSSRRPGQPISTPPPGSASQPELQQDGSAGGDRGPARADDAGPSGGDEPGRFPPIKDTLAVDPVAGGSQSVPDEDDAA